MSMQWLKAWFSRKAYAPVASGLSVGPSRTKSKSRRASFQPQVEQLEEKALPAVFTPTYSVLYPHGHNSFAPWANSVPPASALTPMQIRNAYGMNGITFPSNGSTIA